MGYDMINNSQSRCAGKSLTLFVDCRSKLNLQLLCGFSISTFGDMFMGNPAGFKQQFYGEC